VDSHRVLPTLAMRTVPWLIDFTGGMSMDLRLGFEISIDYYASGTGEALDRSHSGHGHRADLALRTTTTTTTSLPILSDGRVRTTSTFVALCFQ